MVENRVNFKLRYMLACSDEEFYNRVKEAVERRRRFESGEISEQTSDVQDDDGDGDGEDHSDMMSVSELPDDLETDSESEQ